MATKKPIRQSSLTTFFSNQLKEIYQIYFFRMSTLWKQYAEQNVFVSLYLQVLLVEH